MASLVRSTYRVPVRLGGLATAEIAQGPGSIAQHAQLAAVSEEVQQRLQCTAAQYVVTALWAVTSNVSKSPNGLLPDVGFRAGEQLDENRDGAGLNHDLSLSGAARCDVGKRPCSLKLDEGVGGSEELDKSADDAGLYDLLDRRVALLGEKLPESSGGLDLQVNLIGEDALHHLRKILAQL